MPSSTDNFWKEVSTLRGSRERMEDALQKTEWNAALEKYASVAIVGRGEVVQSLQQIKNAMTPDFRCVDLTQETHDWIHRKKSIAGTFEWGMYLLVGLCNKSYPSDLEEFSCYQAMLGGATHAACFASVEDILSHATKISWDCTSIIRHANLLIVHEAPPEQKVIDKILGLMPGSFHRSNLLFFRQDCTLVAKEVASKAMELFEAAATL